MMIEYVETEQHYTLLMDDQFEKVKRTLWIGTADLKDLVHFKLMVFDLKTVYLGSANLTGAGFGMKSIANRNFETGIYTDIPALVEKAMAQFDELWMGVHCKTCGRKKYCSDRIG